jgi:hypothetical protein
MIRKRMQTETQTKMEKFTHDLIRGRFVGWENISSLIKHLRQEDNGICTENDPGISKQCYLDALKKRNMIEDEGQLEN